MLPAAHRLTDGDAFRRTVRAGTRAGSRAVVVHLALDPAAPNDPGSPPLVGLVVSKAVGNAVVRNRVKRRLRHLARGHLGELAQLPGGVTLVVRALPPAAGSSYAELGRDLTRCLSRARSAWDRGASGTQTARRP